MVLIIVSICVMMVVVLQCLVDVYGVVVVAGCDVVRMSCLCC